MFQCHGEAELEWIEYGGPRRAAICKRSPKLFRKGQRARLQISTATAIGVNTFSRILSPVRGQFGSERSP